MSDAPEKSDTDDEIELWPREETPLLDVPIDSATVLRLRQHTSRDDLWGIHGTVWDGGVGTLAFLLKLPRGDDDGLLLDVGAGTGIVGIGASLTSGRRSVVTDLIEAVPLLEENILLNRLDNNNSTSMELTWGEPLPERLTRVLRDAGSVTIVGSDVVYRRNLFRPLLATLTMLLRDNNKAECIIGAWSGRTHFIEFCELAESEEYNFKILWRANVVVEDGTPVRDLEVSYNNNNHDTTDEIKIDYRNVEKGPRIVNIFEFVLKDRSGY